MRILILGSGAREHAIAQALAASPKAPSLHCFGSTLNPGLQGLCTSYQTGDITRPEEVLPFLHHLRPDLAVIGPEAPLEAGIADLIRDSGCPVIGPGALNARIETSKQFARNLMKRVCPGHIPSYYAVSSIEQAQAVLDTLGDEVVIKEDGLCGGKGVTVAGEHFFGRREALDLVRSALSRGDSCIIEEKLTGEEFSLLSFSDGISLAHMPPVQDHKRALEGDRGPNTGGMGSYTGAYGTLPFLTSRDLKEAEMLQVLIRDALQEQTGMPYQGILYGGYMATSRGVRIIEYNARFGDPEVLNILPLLETDLLDVFRSIAEGTLSGLDISFSPKASVCKYLVPPGYPAKSEKGIRVPEPVPTDHTRWFLGSVDLQEDRLVTAGSRTMAVTALGSTLQEAQSLAEEALNRLGGNLVHRRDIGTEALVEMRISHMDALRGRHLRIGVLGSGRGTSLKKLFEQEQEIACAVSDRGGSELLNRCRSRGIPAFHVPSRGRTREETDRDITAVLEAHRVDIVLLAGYMRILSPEFCSRWKGRAFNVHPSLLPEFSGLMDLDVHGAVLSSGRKETGCSIHEVSEEVDAGRVVIQKRCPVEPGDTVSTLREKVQQLEQEALAELVGDYQKGLIHDTQSTQR